MSNFDGHIIEIIHWDKYNPRKDLKATSWVRLQNSLFEDPNFIEFNQAELLFWIYLLSMASKKQSGRIKLSLAHAIRIGRFTERDVNGAITKLIEAECILLPDWPRTPTSHARHVDDTLRTNETNVTNETNIYADPPVSEPLILDFEKLYEEYPRKEGKAEGIKVCEAKIKTKHDYDKLLSAVRRYRDQCKQEGTEKQYIKHFSSFMNKGRWKDWLLPETGSSTIVGSSETDWSKVFEEDPL